MKNKILLFVLLSIGQLGYCQDFKYEFNVVGISDNGPAKLAIEEIRDLLGVRIVKFEDSTDRFIILTDYDFDLIELIEKFETNGFNIDGEISKINIG